MEPIRTLHILVVEDDAVMRGSLVQQISQHKGLVLSGVAANGRQALELISSTHVDMALIDIGLPDMSGIELIQQLGRRHPHCECLVISVFGDEETVIQALCAGAGGYLLKEPQMLDPIGALHSLRSGGSPISPLIARKVLGKVRQLALRSPDAQDNSLLTQREQELLGLLARGYKYDEAAGLMGISLQTVQSYVKVVYRKLAVHSKSEAVYEARVRGLLRD